MPTSQLFKVTLATNGSTLQKVSLRQKKTRQSSMANPSSTAWVCSKCLYEEKTICGAWAWGATCQSLQAGCSTPLGPSPTAAALSSTLTRNKNHPMATTACGHGKGRRKPPPPAREYPLCTAKTKAVANISEFSRPASPPAPPLPLGQPLAALPAHIFHLRVLMGCFCFRLLLVCLVLMIHLSLPPSLLLLLLQLFPQNVPLGT